nr:hypothetical protein [Trentepohlia sp. YN1317]
MTSYRGFAFKDPCFAELVKFLNSGTITSIEGLNRVQYLYARCLLFLLDAFSSQPELISQALGKIATKSQLQETVNSYEKSNGKNVVAHVSLTANVETLKAPAITNSSFSADPTLDSQDEDDDLDDDSTDLTENDEIVDLQAQALRLIGERRELGSKNDAIEIALKEASTSDNLESLRFSVSRGRKSRSVLKTNARKRRDRQAKKTTKKS